MTGFWNLMRLQTALLLRRRLPRWIALAAIGSAVLVVLLASVENGQGHVALAAAAQLLASVLIGLSAVQGAVAVSGDASSGALRAVMVRPVGRPAVVLAHGTIQALFAAGTYIVGIGLALLAAKSLYGFGDAMHGEYVVLTREEIETFATRLLLLPLPALLVAPLIGLCVSVVTDDAATAVVLALALTVGPLLFGLVGGDVPPWVYTERAIKPLTVLEQIAEGVTLEADRVAASRYLGQSIWQPAVWVTVTLSVATLLFSRREIHA